MQNGRSLPVSKMHTSLRKLEVSDKDLLLEWRNDPFLVKRSSSQRVISREEHNDWFNSIMNNCNVLAYIVESDDKPIGHLRLEKQDAFVIITIYLLEKYTGKSYGKKLVHEGCRRSLLIWPDCIVKACVRSDNLPAQHMFKKAGFYQGDNIEDNVIMLYETDEETIAEKRYHTLLSKYGECHSALDWGSEESQELRFEVLSNISNLNACSVLDVGCGLGDFYKFLQDKNINSTYTGLDISKEFIDIANKKYPVANFINSSITKLKLSTINKHDYVFASGIYATYQHGNYTYFESVLKIMWGLANRGVAFNSLSSWAKDKDEGEFYADPIKILKICKQYTDKIVFRHDYHPRDFTIYLLKE